MNGYTVVFSSPPPATPVEATAPLYAVLARAEASVSPPTESTTPIHCCDCRGLFEGGRRPMTSLAPSARSRLPSTFARPVDATTSYPFAARIAIATCPSPPAAPVTSTLPLEGLTPPAASSSLGVATIEELPRLVPSEHHLVSPLEERGARGPDRPSKVDAGHDGPAFDNAFTSEHNHSVLVVQVGVADLNLHICLWILPRQLSERAKGVDGSRLIAFGHQRAKPPAASCAGLR
eukprot:scaffold118925_cov30-Tisochrysis_lutea.AAC.2